MTQAGAVRDTHPDITLEIWKDRIESFTGTVKLKSYRESMGSLWGVKSLLQETGRGEAFPAYVAELRERHGGNPRLVEELDFLERNHRKIVDGVHRQVTVDATGCNRWSFTGTERYV